MIFRLDPKKFSELPPTEELDGSELLPLVKDGENAVATVDTLRGGSTSIEVMAGQNIAVDNTNPAAPIVSLDIPIQLTPPDSPSENDLWIPL